MRSDETRTTQDRELDELLARGQEQLLAWLDEVIDTEDGLRRLHESLAGRPDVVSPGDPR